MIKIIVVPDSFKGSATSLEVCNLIEEGYLELTDFVVLATVRFLHDGFLEEDILKQN